MSSPTPARRIRLAVSTTQMLKRWKRVAGVGESAAPSPAPATASARAPASAPAPPAEPPTNSPTPPAALHTQPIAVPVRRDSVDTVPTRSKTSLSPTPAHPARPVLLRADSERKVKTGAWGESAVTRPHSIAGIPTMDEAKPLPLPRRSPRAEPVWMSPTAPTVSSPLACSPPISPDTWDAPAFIAPYDPSPPCPIILTPPIDSPVSLTPNPSPPRTPCAQRPRQDVWLCRKPSPTDCKNPSVRTSVVIDRRVDDGEIISIACHRGPNHAPKRPGHTSRQSLPGRLTPPHRPNASSRPARPTLHRSGMRTASMPVLPRRTSDIKSGGVTVEVKVVAAA